ncbi:MAG: hypothetical protein DRH12_01375 [Deltaproteobacteria bacterium]|nr:MAG: hypothetical protein DRH12_01375 [Deltaproteobacteria bacterium]
MHDSTKGSSIVATIRNQYDPSQEVSILYLAADNGFATSGIMEHFGLREIFIPAYMVVQDLELMGTIVAVILEEISRAHESEGVFQYSPYLEVMGKEYTMKESGEYMMLEEAI